MPWEVFAVILQAALAPLGEPALHPEAFYAGRRLVGIDGTQFSCSNTPRILGTMTKAASRRFEAALAKLGGAVLVEPGTHAPLAAAISAPDLAESESALARELLGSLPADSLLLGGRLYGHGTFIGRLFATVAAGPEQTFLLRVGTPPKPEATARLSDGSTLVKVASSREEAQTLCIKAVQVRGQVRRTGGAWSEVRLWTSLLDEKVHPALELLGFYARRWEQEIAYCELKVDLRASENRAPTVAPEPSGPGHRYALGQWPTLGPWLEDGRAGIDDNLVENAIRPMAVGKKNWLFVGETEAGSTGLDPRRAHWELPAARA